MTGDLEPSVDLGPRPTMEWLPLDQLAVDPTYQRDTHTRRSRDRIKRIVERFAWRRFQPPTVAIAANGKYAVLDGQHRVEAARQHPDISEVPCYIVSAEEVRQQADSFVHINKERGNVPPTQLFYAELAARDPDALHIADICRRTGIAIARAGRPDGLPPGETLAVGKIKRLLAAYGDTPVVHGISALVQAAGEERDQLRAEVIAGSVSFFANFGDDPKFDFERFVAALGSRTAEEWLEDARAYKKLMKGSTEVAIRIGILRAYNKGLRAQALAEIA